MQLFQKPSKTYEIHRGNQRERILEAAERLFIEEGIDQVHMSDIARAARMTRNTLYEYFPTKQDIAWAILQNIFEHGRARSEIAQAGNGYQRLEKFMSQMVSQIETNTGHLRFIVEFNTLYAREASSERMRQATGRTGDQDANPVADWVRQGIDDGSIRPDLDPSLVAAAAWNLLSGMNARFALLGGLIEQEYNHPVISIYQEICRVFLRGLKPSSSE